MNTASKCCNPSSAGAAADGKVCAQSNECKCNHASAHAAPMELDVSSADAVHASVREYYGRKTEVLGEDVAHSCAVAGPAHPLLKAALSKVPAEVLERFYGCGNPLPLGLQGLTVLDLGSGSGRDCFISAQLVGERGRVIGVDMTDEQLEVARRAVGPFTKAMGYAKPNVEFVKGFIEQLTAAGVAPGSVDVCISNCVVNLAHDKRAVLKSVFEVLRPGGEFHFSDVYADRRLSDAVRRHPTLVGACIGGALYANDFEQLAREVGFADPRILSMHAQPLPAQMQEVLGDTRFFSITYRLFKVAELEPTHESYHQTALYKGTIPGHPDSYPLDLHRTFIANKARPVCSNTAALLAHSWLAQHFVVTGDRSQHFGAAPVMPPVTQLMADTPKAAAASAGGCCGKSSSASLSGGACGCAAPTATPAQCACNNDAQKTDPAGAGSCACRQ